MRGVARRGAARYGAVRCGVVCTAANPNLTKLSHAIVNLRVRQAQRKGTRLDGLGIGVEVSTILRVKVYHYRLVLRLGPYVLCLLPYKPSLNL